MIAICSNFSEDSKDIFFSLDSSLQGRARRVCDICPFRQECEILGKNEYWGIWGGQVKDNLLMPASSQFKSRATCSKGLHDWLPENILSTGSRSICRVCSDLKESNRIKEIQRFITSNRSKCRVGHPWIAENLEFAGKKNYLRCRKCRMLRTKKLERIEL